MQEYPEGRITQSRLRHDFGPGKKVRVTTEDGTIVRVTCARIVRKQDDGIVFWIDFVDTNGFSWDLANGDGSVFF